MLWRKKLKGERVCFSSQVKVVHRGVEVKMAKQEVAAHLKSAVRRVG